MILIGEPTSVDRLGDTVKIGRRGSVNMWIEVPGVQGHVAYPHRADNPIPPLARVVAALDAVHLDDGTDAFPPSNLEFTAISTPTQREQRHPRLGDARSSTSASTTSSAAPTWCGMVEEIAEREAPGAEGHGAHLGRGVPHAAGPALRRRWSRRSEEETGDRSPSCRPAAARPTAAS